MQDFFFVQKVEEKRSMLQALCSRGQNHICTSFGASYEPSYGKITNFLGPVSFRQLKKKKK